MYCRAVSSLPVAPRLKLPMMLAISAAASPASLLLRLRMCAYQTGGRMPVFHHDAVRPALICRTGEWAGIARVTADVTAAGTFQFCTFVDGSRLGPGTEKPRRLPGSEAAAWNRGGAAAIAATPAAAARGGRRMWRSGGGGRSGSDNGRRRIEE